MELLILVLCGIWFTICFGLWLLVKGHLATFRALIGGGQGEEKAKPQIGGGKGEE